jgi:hypothetical protein
MAKQIKPTTRIESKLKARPELRYADCSDRFLSLGNKNIESYIEHEIIPNTKPE